MPSKKIRLQLYADENFPVGSVKYLKSLGVSIVHAYSFGNVKKSDLYHLKFCATKQRALITLDRDFSYNWTTLKNHPGVILISSGKQTPDAINKICTKSFHKLTPNFVSGSLVRITIDKILRNKNEEIEKIKL